MIQFGLQYIIWFMVGITMIIVVACSVPADLNVDSHIPFFKVGRIPIVEGKINGKKAYFIIDTGASVSILNESVSERFGFNLLYTNDQHIVGFSGHVKINEVKNCVVDWELSPLEMWLSKPGA